MTDRQPSPPGLALWLLRHAYQGDHKEALAGDLVERFCAGETRAWLWRQVFLACVVSALGSVRRRWPLFCYAIAGTVAVGFDYPFYSYLDPLRASLHWSDLPWPLSQFVLELGIPALVSFLTLFVLAIGLMIAGSFRWSSLLRTWMANLILIAIDYFLADLFPSLLLSIPGDPYHKVLIIPPTVQILLLALTFLVAGWLGCPILARSENSGESTVELR